MQATGHWYGEVRPIETNFTVSPGGTLRIQNRERWIECNAKEFLLAALSCVVPRGPMQKWKDAVSEELPDNHVIDITSCETTGDMAVVAVSGGRLALEMLVSADLKQVCAGVAKEMRTIRVELDFVELLKAAWWG